MSILGGVFFLYHTISTKPQKIPKVCTTEIHKRKKQKSQWQKTHILNVNIWHFRSKHSILCKSAIIIHKKYSCLHNFTSFQWQRVCFFQLYCLNLFWVILVLSVCLRFTTKKHKILLKIKQISKSREISQIQWLIRIKNAQFHWSL